MQAAAPAVPAPTINSISPDSGTVGDGITNATVLTLDGTAEANSTVKVYDGSTLLGTATANANGVWSFTTGTLGNGGHVFTATATDAAGNTGTASPVLNMTVDTTAPVAPTLNSISPDSGTVGDGITNATVVTLNGTAEANSTVNVYDGATLLGTATANGSGVWSFITATLGSGGHAFTATATDAAGNTGAASPALNMTVDTTAPVAPTISSISPDSGTAGDGITNATVLALNGTAEANSAVKVYDGATLLGTATANGSGVWTFTTGALANGTHVFTATATDAAGNSSPTSSALNMAVDTTAPVAPTISSISPDSGTVGDGITNAAVLTLNGTAEVNSTVKVYDGAALLGIANTNASGVWSFVTNTLANGAHIFAATATDAAGNTGAASSLLQVSVDPVTFAMTESLKNDTGPLLNDRFTMNDTLIGSGEPNAVVHFTVDSQPISTTVTADSNGSWTFTPIGLTSGPHTIVASETDQAGNTGTVSLNFAFAKGGTSITGTWNPDGTVHDIHYYGFLGLAYTDYDVVYGANNEPASAIYSNGMTYAWTYNGDGKLHELVVNGITTQNFNSNAGQYFTTTDTLYDANGNSATEVWTNGTAIVQKEVWNPDGTVHDNHYYGITGQPFTNFDVVFGATGKTSEVWTNGATTVLTEAWKADGTIHDIHYYAIIGQAYTDYDVTYGANNQPVSATYSNGMTKTWTYNGDGSSETVLNNVQGQSYTSLTSVFDPNYSVNNHFAAQGTINTNGSQTLHGYENGLTIAQGATGASISLPSPGNDTFNFAFNSQTTLVGGGTNEKFVLNSGFGNVTISDFIANSLPNTNHDSITLTGGVFRDFADLQSHMTQDKLGNTIIADGHGDSLTLSHTVIANLHANDFIIV